MQKLPKLVYIHSKPSASNSGWVETETGFLHLVP